MGLILILTIIIFQNIFFFKVISCKNRSFLIHKKGNGVLGGCRIIIEELTRVKCDVFLGANDETLMCET